MDQKKALLLLLCLISPAIPQGQQPLSAVASRIIDGRNLAQQVDESNQRQVKETSPSPAPDPAVPKPKSGDDKVANPPNTVSDSEGTCDLNFNRCHDEAQNIIACLLPKAGDASSGLFLLVRNFGENSLKLNVTIPAVNKTLQVLLEHRSQKIKEVPSNASVIVLHAAKWTCNIGRVGVTVSFPSYIANIRPINGVYLLFGTALLIGVFWGCCKVGKDIRHLSGVPYQELEMGQQENGASMNVESIDGWDQSWDDDDDDDWDEEKVLKSGGGNHVENVRENGVSSRPTDTDGWQNDWNDS